MNKFSVASEKHLAGVHEDLVKVFREAIKGCPVDFRITDGKRTLAEQKKLVAKGASKTLRSRHLTGKAVDVVALVNGKVSWEVPPYKVISAHVLAVAKKLKIPIVWGGSWRSFPDFVHFELDKRIYGY